VSEAYVAGLREIVRYRKVLEQTQWWSASRLHQWQVRRLVELVSHAREQVPYYAERLAGLPAGKARFEEHWSAIPRLTKAGVRENAHRLRSRTFTSGHGLARRSSSGSSGHPLTIVKEMRPRMALWAIKLRGFGWFKTEFGGKRMRLVAPSAGEPYGSVHHRRDWGSPLNSLYRTGAACQADVYLSIERQIELLDAEQPQYLITYPTNLQLLLTELRRRGRRLPSLSYVQTQGAQLDPEMRDECRAVLGVPLYDIYGATEGDWIAVQCPQQPHYHLQSELNFIEVLAEDGRPCRAGEVGRIVVTPFHSYAMPLLRYEMEDYAEVGEPCPCGRGLPVLRRILGRERSLLTLPNGEKRMAPFGTRIFAELSAIRQFRMVQTGLARIEVRFVADRVLTGKESAHIIHALGNQLTPEFKVTLRRVDELPRSKSGKWLEFVSEL
jgi:phenylacetate-CoA ligase